MLFLIRRYWSDKRRLRRMMRDFRPRTGRIVAITIACAVAAGLLAFGALSLFSHLK